MPNDYCDDDYQSINKRSKLGVSGFVELDRDYSSGCERCPVPPMVSFLARMM